MSCWKLFHFRAESRDSLGSWCVEDLRSVVVVDACVRDLRCELVNRLRMYDGNGFSRYRLGLCGGIGRRGNLNTFVIGMRLA